VRLLGLLALLGIVTPAAQELPAGSGPDEVIRRCVTCHETDLIAQQRLSPAAWGREVDKMIRWGAGVERSERDPLVAYLARYFSAAPVVRQEAVSSAAEVTYKRACLVCHEADIIDSQRLGPAGWTREVAKMIRWGAIVSPPEQAPLIDFLAREPTSRSFK
jgi:cytochrome c2